jgi:hypothetical protein
VRVVHSFDCKSACHDDVYSRFWRPELDLEDPEAVGAALQRGGVDPEGFPAFLAASDSHLAW